MKLVFFLYFSAFYCFKCYSQKMTFVYSIEPNWDNNNPEIIKLQFVKNDSILL